MERWNGGQQTVVGFKVAMPGIKPLTTANMECMTLPPAKRPKGCAPLEFHLFSAGGSARSDEIAFENMRSLFHSQTPASRKYGFDVYETGPADARIETYVQRVPDHLLIIQCFLNKNDDTEHPSVCGCRSRLSNGTGLQYYFGVDQLSVAVTTDKDVRHLVNSFVVNGKGTR